MIETTVMKPGTTQDFYDTKTEKRIHAEFERIESIAGWDFLVYKYKSSDTGEEIKQGELLIGERGTFADSVASVVPATKGKGVELTYDRNDLENIFSFPVPLPYINEAKASFLQKHSSFPVIFSKN